MANRANRAFTSLCSSWLFSMIAPCVIALSFPGASIALDPIAAEKARRTIQSWLECSNCDSEEMKPVIEIGKDAELGAAAVESFRVALVDGPSDGDIELLRSHLRKSYEKLNHSPTPPSRSLDVYVSDYEQNYVARYKKRAARALGAIGSEQARRALDEAGNKPNPKDVERAIQEALKNIR